ncbi:hypothetical protein A9K71_21185 [Mesorhizobium sp. WSM3873]|nr:hypothetical protein A9K71_21185 [Mesorhizobium sp. WSM3873]
MAVGSGSDIAVGCHEVTYTKTRQRNFGETCNIDGTVRCKRCNRWRAILDQGAENIALDNSNVMACCDVGQLSAPCLAHQRRQGVNHRRLEEHGADRPLPTSFVQRLWNHSFLISRKSLQTQSKIARQWHERVKTEHLGGNA